MWTQRKKAPYFACLLSLHRDNKEVFSSTQLPRLVKGTEFIKNDAKSATDGIFSLSPPPAAASCIPDLVNPLCKPSRLQRVPREDFGADLHAHQGDVGTCNITQPLGLPKASPSYAICIPAPSSTSSFPRGKKHRDKFHQGNTESGLHHPLRSHVIQIKIRLDFKAVQPFKHRQAF